MTPSLIDASLARVRHGGSGGPEEAMNWHRWLATLVVMLALAECPQGGWVPYSPYSPENMHERGVTVAAACSGQGQSDLA
jgi:hypothetical protein